MDVREREPVTNPILGHLLAGKIVLQGELDVGPMAGQPLFCVQPADVFARLIQEMAEATPERRRQIERSTAASIRRHARLDAVDMAPAMWRALLDDLVVTTALRLVDPDRRDGIALRRARMVLMEHEGRIVGTLSDTLIRRYRLKPRLPTGEGALATVLGKSGGRA